MYYYVHRYIYCWADCMCHSENTNFHLSCWWTFLIFRHALPAARIAFHFIYIYLFIVCAAATRTRLARYNDQISACHFPSIYIHVCLGKMAKTYTWYIQKSFQGLLMGKYWVKRLEFIQLAPQRKPNTCSRKRLPHFILYYIHIYT